jgi:hypothetical protein
MRKDNHEQHSHAECAGEPDESAPSIVVCLCDELRAVEVSGYAEDFSLQTMDAFLAQARNAAEPFFAFYNIATPHMPFFDVPRNTGGCTEPRTSSCATTSGWMGNYPGTRNGTPRE